MNKTRYKLNSDLMELLVQRRLALAVTQNGCGNACLSFLDASGQMSSSVILWISYEALKTIYSVAIIKIKHHNLRHVLSTASTGLNF